eukprot:COSAG03_NODE_17954_length_365_cov_0.496241_1_plen_42_part_01
MEKQKGKQPKQCTSHFPANSGLRRSYENSSALSASISLCTAT